MTIVYIVGARPNFMKMAPVLAAMRERMPDERHVLVHTGQHYDREMSALFIDELGLPSPDYHLGVGSASHAFQTAEVMKRIETVFESEHPDLVIVPGDVNSTLAAALVSVKLRIPLAHVESGLRSFDRTMPEEINRIIADTFSDFLFVHSEEPATNLSQEGIGSDRIFFVGNTMIDSLVAFESRFLSAGAPERLGLCSQSYLLVTLHRPELVDGPLLGSVMNQLGDLAQELPVVFPVHPRTRKMMKGIAIENAVRLVDPLGYVDFLSLLADAKAVITDSGGVQEETTYLGVPCFTLRNNTERPVTVRMGTNHLLGLDPNRISEILSLLLIRDYDRTALSRPPMWDGHASERIADVISEWAKRSSLTSITRTTKSSWA